MPLFANPLLPCVVSGMLPRPGGGAYGGCAAGLICDSA